MSNVFLSATFRLRPYVVNCTSSLVYSVRYFLVRYKTHSEECILGINILSDLAKREYFNLSWPLVTKLQSINHGTEKICTRRPKANQGQFQFFSIAVLNSSSTNFQRLNNFQRHAFFSLKLAIMSVCHQWSRHESKQWSRMISSTVKHPDSLRANNLKQNFLNNLIGKRT